MLRHFYTAVVLACLFFTTPQILNAQCNAVVQDSLLPNYDLQLVAVPVSGVPPFTYTWNISGSLLGPLTPTYVSTHGDTALISSTDLFTNYGCVIISLCVHDSTGCTNCFADTAYTQAIICYSGFSASETTPGHMMVMLPNPVPEFIGVSMMTWYENATPQSGPVINGHGEFEYHTDTYNPNGYDVPLCVQTIFWNSNNFCMWCDTVHFSSAIINGVAPGQNSQPYYTLGSNPVVNQLLIQPGSAATKIDCDLTDLNGRLLATASSASEPLRIDMTTLPKGVYLMRIYSQQFTRIEKIVKQ